MFPRCFVDWQQVQEVIEINTDVMLDDPEMYEMAQDELREAGVKKVRLLLPKDPDKRNAFLSPCRNAATSRRRSQAICSVCGSRYAEVTPLAVKVPRARG